MAGRTGPLAWHYQPLIGQAPEVEKSDRQGVFDSEPVEKGRMSRNSTSERSLLPFSPPSSKCSHSSLEKLAVTPLSAADSYSKDVTKSRSAPWYRTIKGLAIIIVITLVVVGAIVEVAVGVIQSKKNKSKGSGPVRDTNEVTPFTAAATTTNAVAATATTAIAVTATTALTRTTTTDLSRTTTTALAPTTTGVAGANGRITVGTRSTSPNDGYGASIVASPNDGYSGVGSANDGNAGVGNANAGYAGVGSANDGYAAVGSASPNGSVASA